MQVLSTFKLTETLPSNESIEENLKKKKEKKKTLESSISKNFSVVVLFCVLVGLFDCFLVRRKNSWFISRSNKFWIFFSDNHAFGQTNVVGPTRIFMTELWIKINLVQCLESKISWIILSDLPQLLRELGLSVEETLGRPYKGLSVSTSRPTRKTGKDSLSGCRL